MKELEQNVIRWATERGIYEHSTAQAQTLKAVSEMGELADAIIKDDDGAAMDAVGDVIVCLINVAHMRGFDLEEALQAAWGEIKHRKGRMVPGGAFVKE
nr:MazG-like family protein [Pseudomonas sp.]